MEQSEAERQLVGLLLGLDVSEFSLQISIKEKRSDPLLMGGGTILPEDIEALERLGVDKVFGVDTPLDEIVEFIRTAVRERRVEVS